MPVPDFSPGEVLTSTAMDSIGLWLVKTQTIGTAVSSVTVSDAFSADYDIYLINVVGGATNSGTAMNLTLGATASNYYSSGFNQSMTSATINATNTTAGSSWASAVLGSIAGFSGQITLDGPFIARRTMVSYQARTSTTAGLVNQQHGFLSDTTSYTAFTLTMASGTMTGGTIRVYGYRN
jgi:hypothetical protein